MTDLFNTGTSNNAPLPIPGGFGNPTGANPGFAGSGGKDALTFPTMPMFGGAPKPIAQSTTSGLNAGPNAPSDFSGLSTGMKIDPALAGNFQREFQRAYGKGTGDILYQMLTQGLFNPQTASAFLNAQQPGIQRGQADILNAFGRTGNRFSSSAQLGLGDYMSQVNLNQGQLLASLFEQSQNQGLNLLENSMNTLHTEEANNGGGWIDNLVGGLEIAGGLIGAPFTGGASLALVGAGIGQMTGGGGKSNNQAQAAQGIQGFKGLFDDSGGVDLSSESLGLPGDKAIFDNLINQLIGSGGSMFGGADATSGGDMPFGLF
jgi:hypothetical protein